MTEIKQHEYALLNEIAQDSMVTQANLSVRLGIAVGSVNWYLKRLIRKGYVKAMHLERRRLKYLVTPQGLALKAARLDAVYVAFEPRSFETFLALASDEKSEAQHEERHECLFQEALRGGDPAPPSPEAT